MNEFQKYGLPVDPIKCDYCTNKKIEPMNIRGNKFCEHFVSENFKNYINGYLKSISNSTEETREKQERNKRETREKQERNKRETREKQERNKRETREKQERNKRETREKQERNKRSPVS